MCIRDSIQGVDTNVDYQFEIMNDPDYQKGVFDIGFLESHQIGGVKVNEACLLYTSRCV